MAEELELVMDIDTLEIFEVKSSDDNSKNDLGSPEEMVEEQVKNITFIRDKYVVSIMRKGKNYSKSFEKLEEAIKHRDMVLKDYKETGVLPKKRIEEVISKYQELIGRRFQNLTAIDVVGLKKKKVILI